MQETKSYRESCLKQAKAEHIRVTAILQTLLNSPSLGSAHIQKIITEKEARLIQLEKDYPVLREAGEMK